MKIGKLNVVIAANGFFRVRRGMKYWLPCRLTMKPNPPIYAWLFWNFSYNLWNFSYNLEAFNENRNRP